MIKNSHLFSGILPVVIKELRQELRMRSFAFLFLVPQAILFLYILMTTPSDDGAFDSSRAFSWIFWATLLIPLFLLIPRRGIVTLNKEVEANSLDLVFLAGVSAWKLVFGKWLALALLSTLFLIAVAPYVLLRYFAGDTNFMGTLSNVGLIFMCSIITSATAVASSGAGRKRRGSAIFVIGMVILLYYAVIISTSVWSGFSSKVLSWQNYVMSFAFAPIGLLLLLENGVGRLAPPLENYVVRKRVLGLLCLGLCASFLIFRFGESALTLGITIVLLLPVILSSLFEEPHPILLRNAKLRRSLKGWMFWPGWPGGIVYAVILSTLLLYLSFYAGLFKRADFFTAWLHLQSSLLLPVGYLRLFRGSRMQTIMGYLFFQFFLFLFSMMGMSYPSTRSSTLGGIAISLSVVSFFGALDGKTADLQGFLFLKLTVAAVSLLILAKRLREILRGRALPRPVEEQIV